MQEHGGDYGLQKLFGTAGAVFFSPLAGKIIDISSSSADYEDYSGLFVLYFVLRLVTAVLILQLKLDFKVGYEQGWTKKTSSAIFWLTYNRET